MQFRKSMLTDDPSGWTEMELVELKDSGRERTYPFWRSGPYAVSRDGGRFKAFVVVGDRPFMVGDGFGSFGDAVAHIKGPWETESFRKDMYGARDDRNRGRRKVTDQLVDEAVAKVKEKAERQGRDVDIDRVSMERLKDLANALAAKWIMNVQPNTDRSKKPPLKGGKGATAAKKGNIWNKRPNNVETDAYHSGRLLETYIPLLVEKTFEYAFGPLGEEAEEGKGKGKGKGKKAEGGPPREDMEAELDERLRAEGANPRIIAPRGPLDITDAIHRANLYTELAAEKATGRDPYNPKRRPTDKRAGRSMYGQYRNEPGPRETSWQAVLENHGMSDAGSEWGLMAAPRDWWQYILSIAHGGYLDADIQPADEDEWVKMATDQDYTTVSGDTEHWNRRMFTDPDHPLQVDMFHNTANGTWPERTVGDVDTTPGHGYAGEYMTRRELQDLRAALRGEGQGPNYPATNRGVNNKMMFVGGKDTTEDVRNAMRRLQFERRNLNPLLLGFTRGRAPTLDTVEREKEKADEAAKWEANHFIGNWLRGNAKALKGIEDEEEEGKDSKRYKEYYDSIKSPYTKYHTVGRPSPEELAALSDHDRRRVERNFGYQIKRRKDARERNVEALGSQVSAAMRDFKNIKDEWEDANREPYVPYTRDELAEEAVRDYLSAPYQAKTTEDLVRDPLARLTEYPRWLQDLDDFQAGGMPDDAMRSPMQDAIDARIKYERDTHPDVYGKSFTEPYEYDSYLPDRFIEDAKRRITAFRDVDADKWLRDMYEAYGPDESYESWLHHGAWLPEYATIENEALARRNAAIEREAREYKRNSENRRRAEEKYGGADVHFFDYYSPEAIDYFMNESLPFNDRIMALVDEEPPATYGAITFGPRFDRLQDMWSKMTPSERETLSQDTYDNRRLQGKLLPQDISRFNEDMKERRAEELEDQVESMLLRKKSPDEAFVEKWRNLVAERDAEAREREKDRIKREEFEANLKRSKEAEKAEALLNQTYRGSYDEFSNRFRDMAATPNPYALNNEDRGFVNEQTPGEGGEIKRVAIPMRRANPDTGRFDYHESAYRVKMPDGTMRPVPVTEKAWNKTGAADQARMLLHSYLEGAPGDEGGEPTLNDKLRLAGDMALQDYVVGPDWDGTLEDAWNHTADVMTGLMDVTDGTNKLEEYIGNADKLHKLKDEGAGDGGEEDGDEHMNKSMRGRRARGSGRSFRKADLDDADEDDDDIEVTDYRPHDRTYSQVNDEHQKEFQARFNNPDRGELWCPPEEYYRSETGEMVPGAALPVSEEEWNDMTPAQQERMLHMSRIAAGNFEDVRPLGMWGDEVDSEGTSLPGYDPDYDRAILMALQDYENIYEGERPLTNEFMYPGEYLEEVLLGDPYTDPPVMQVDTGKWDTVPSYTHSYGYPLTTYNHPAYKEGRLGESTDAWGRPLDGGRGSGDGPKEPKAEPADAESGETRKSAEAKSVDDYIREAVIGRHFTKPHGTETFAKADDRPWYMTDEDNVEPIGGDDWTMKYDVWKRRRDAARRSAGGEGTEGFSKKSVYPDIRQKLLDAILDDEGRIDDRKLASLMKIRDLERDRLIKEKGGYTPYDDVNTLNDFADFMRETSRWGQEYLNEHPGHTGLKGDSYRRHSNRMLNQEAGIEGRRGYDEAQYGDQYLSEESPWVVNPEDDVGDNPRYGAETLDGTPEPLNLPQEPYAGPRMRDARDDLRWTSEGFEDTGRGISDAYRYSDAMRNVPSFEDYVRRGWAKKPSEALAGVMEEDKPQGGRFDDGGIPELDDFVQPYRDRLGYGIGDEDPGHVHSIPQNDDKKPEVGGMDDRRGGHANDHIPKSGPGTGKVAYKKGKEYNGSVAAKKSMDDFVLDACRHRFGKSEPGPSGSKMPEEDEERLRANDFRSVMAAAQARRDGSAGAPAGITGVNYYNEGAPMFSGIYPVRVDGRGVPIPDDIKVVRDEGSVRKL